MRIVIVGRRNGKAVVRWPQFLGLGVVLSLVLGLGTGLVFCLLAGRWSPLPVVFGVFWGTGMAALGVIGGLRTPTDRLTPIGADPDGEQNSSSD